MLRDYSGAHIRNLLFDRFLIFRFFLVLVFFNGAIIAVSKYVGTSWLSSYIPGFAMALLFCLLLMNFYRRFDYRYLIMTYILMSLIVFLFLKSIIAFHELDFHAIYIIASYYLFPFLVLMSVKHYVNKKTNILRMVRNFSFLLVIVAYIQLFMANYIPYIFRQIPDMNLEHIGVIEFSGFTYNTPNGLVGNAMIFGTFLLISLSLHLDHFFNNRNKNNILKLLLLYGMIFLIFSRAAILGAILITFIFCFFYFDIRKLLFFLSGALVAIALMVFLLYGKVEYLTYSIDRILGVHPNAVASTSEHIEDYRKVFAEIMISPYWGAKIGSDFEDRIITDGTWFQNLLDMGIIVFIFYIVLWIYILYAALTSVIYERENRRLAIIVLSIWVYLLIANFLNSSYLAKINSSTFMLLFGLLFFSRETYMLRRRTVVC